MLSGTKAHWDTCQPPPFLVTLGPNSPGQLATQAQGAGPTLPPQDLILPRTLQRLQRQGDRSPAHSPTPQPKWPPGLRSCWPGQSSRTPETPASHSLGAFLPSSPP